MMSTDSSPPDSHQNLIYIYAAQKGKDAAKYLAASGREFHLQDDGASSRKLARSRLVCGVEPAARAILP
jgi:hypothetical protein